MIQSRGPTLAVALTALLALASPGTAQSPFVEDFTTTTHRDSSGTTATWDTTAGELKLPPFVPSLVGTYDTLADAQEVVVAGDHAYLVDGVSGLQVLDITDLSAPVLVGGYDTPGSATGVAVSGNHAYVADLTGLLIMDVSDPTNPVLVATYDTPGSARQVVVSGDHAFVADDLSGMQIIDISDAAAPTLAGTHDTPGQCLDVFVAGGHAYLADHSAGMQVIDISDPTAPTLAGSTTTTGPAWGVCVAGDRAYVAEGLLGLRVYDVSDPTAPSAVGGYTTPDHARDVYVDGDYAYVPSRFGGLVILDVADPTPTLHSAYNTSGTAFAVVVAGEHAFVGDGITGLKIIKVRETVTPALVGTFDASSAPATAVAVAGNLAILAQHADGIFILDTTDPANPVLVGSYDTPGTAYEVFVDGDYAYVADGASGLQILDISDPTAPTLAGTVNTPSSCRDVFVAGGHAYLADWEGFSVIDVSDPAAPAQVGSVDPPGFALEVTVAGDAAFVASLSSGLQVIDISDPMTPALVGSYIPAGGVEGVAVSGDLGFLACSAAGLRVVDLGDPTNPVLLGSSASPGFAIDVAATGNLVFLAEYTGGLRVIDVSDPANPTPIDSFNTTANSVALAGDFAFLACDVPGQDFSAVQVFGSDFAIHDNIGQSLLVDGQSEIIIAARVTTTQTTGVTWELSADAGNNWQSFTPGEEWAPFSSVGTDLLWRSTHTWSPNGINPTVSDLTVEWQTFQGPSGFQDTLLVAEGYHDNDAFAIYPNCSASAGDLNGDGFNDLVIGAGYWIAPGWTLQTGRVSVYFTGSDSDANADIVIDAGPVNQLWLGFTTAGVGDTNGDGFDDLLVSGQAALSYQGRAYLFHGSASWPGSLVAAAADLKINGEVGLGQFAGDAGPVGDLNADGLADFYVSPRSEYPSYPNTRSYVFLGDSTATGVISAADADIIFEGPPHFAQRGDVGDFNGDDVPDFAFASHYDDGTLAAGQIFVFFGDPAMSGIIPAANADLVITPTASSPLEKDVSFGDVNGDSYDDLVFYRVGDGINPRKAYVIYGGNAVPSSMTADDANVTITAESVDAAFAVFATGDWDGDGDDEIVASAPLYDGTSSNIGRVYMFLGGQDLPASVPALAADIIADGSYDEGWFGTFGAWIPDVLADRSALLAYHWYNPSGVAEVTAFLSPASGATSVDALVPQQAGLRLHDSAPNPFREGTTIAFELPREGPVSIAVYNVAGRRVRSLENRVRPAGAHKVQWDGRAEDGRRVSSGVYFYKLQVEGAALTKRVVVAR